MHVIAKKKLNNFIKLHPDAGGWLNSWWKIASTAVWTCLGDVRKQYPSVSMQLSMEELKKYIPEMKFKDTGVEVR